MVAFKSDLIYLVKKTLPVLSLSLFMTLVFTMGLAQNSDIVISEYTKRIDIPFSYLNGFIVVEVTINGVLPLRFVLDTGAEHTIISKREITDLLQIGYERRLTIYGADLSNELYAYLARGVTIEVGRVVGLNRSVLVLEEDYFNFEAFTGTSIHGILGSDFFRRFVIRINYRKRTISLYPPRHFKPPSSAATIATPISINRHKPYIYATVSIQEDRIDSLRLLLDTGAGLPLLLETNSNPRLKMPQQVVPSELGIGLGGQIQGYMGRVSKLHFADFQFQEVLTNFQDLSFLSDTVFTETRSRNGIIGNDILDRFTITLDYHNERAYFAPNRRYKKAFDYDRSGLQIIASGPDLSVFTVYNVLPDSPAGEAGVLEGDEIIRINGRGVSAMSLSSITRILQKKAGKKIKMVLRRNDEKYKVEFKLRDII